MESEIFKIANRYGVQKLISDELINIDGFISFLVDRPVRCRKHGCGVVNYVLDQFSAFLRAVFVHLTDFIDVSLTECELKHLSRYRSIINTDAHISST